MENVVADHLSRLILEEDNEEIKDDTFPNEYVMVAAAILWYSDLVNYLVTSDLSAY